jgi:hypothetical protein
MSVKWSVPRDLYQEAVEIAASNHISVEEFFRRTLQERVAWEKLQIRAARGDRQKFLAVLNKVPDVEPEDYDKL